jgi:monomeric sarcosine oxidase
MAVQALNIWNELEEETGEKLITHTGILLIGNRQPSFEIETYETLRSLGLEAEMLAKEEVAYRFPQFDTQAFEYGVFDPSGAIAHAESALRASINLAQRLGVDLIEDEQVIGFRHNDSRIESVITYKETAIECEKVIIASGPWTRKLLPSLQNSLRTTRQEVVYFEPPISSSNHVPPNCDFQIGRFPIFIALDTGFYGFPAHNRGAIKIANHNKGEHLDTDSYSDEVSEDAIRQCRDFFKEFIPALADSRVYETRVCIYNNTPDDDFIIDRHPQFSNAVIATGFSGHGFKFGPLIGRIAAQMSLDSNFAYETDRFNISRFNENSTEE